MLNSEVMNRPFVRDITKTCECVCATESNAVGLQNAEPLTLEELRQMDGKPVYYKTAKMWFIVSLNHPEFGDCVINVSGQYIPLEKAARQNRFYAAEPHHLNRSAWKPCEMCGDKRAIKLSCNFSGGAIIKVVGESLEVSGDDKAIPLFKKSYEPAFWIKFCPWCGRPLTDAAWNMLEKRLECTK